MAIHRPPQPGVHRSPLRFIVPPLLLVAAVVGVLLFVDLEGGPELDADLCPISPNDIVHRAVLLMDLRKPLASGASGHSLAGEALQAVNAEIGANTELTVFSVSANQDAALQQLARLCKPYNSAGPEVGGAAEEEDCAVWPPQLTGRDLENAMRFCARRNALQMRIDALAARPSVPVESAFLMEAIEEISLSLADDPGQKSLYVFSDMLPHADWYSHIELGGNWNFADYVSVREEQSPTLGSRPLPVAGLAATLLYVPRQGITGEPDAKAAHLLFWRAYFADLTGRNSRFVELPLAHGYAVAPFMNELSAVEVVALERERLQREREAAERDLARLAQAREELEEVRKQALEQRRQLEANNERDRVEAQPPPVEAGVEPRREETTPSTPIAAEPAPQRPTAVEPAPPVPVEDVPAAEVALNVESAAAEAPSAIVESPLPVPVEDIPAAEVAPNVESVAEAPSATVGSPATAAVACNADLMPRFALRAPAYPGRYRADYGSATITLSYTVDDEGNTVDDSVEVVADASSATRPAFLDMFADEARKTVERYRYEFDERSDSECRKRQRLTARFVFQYSR